MSFGKFFLYYLGSAFLVQMILIGMYSVKVLRQRNKLKKDLASGKVKMITRDEVLEQMGTQEDKKTWN